MSHKPLQFSETMIDEDGIEFERVEVFAGSSGHRISGYVDIPFGVRPSERQQMITERHQALQLQAASEQYLFQMRAKENRQNFAIKMQELRQAAHERTNRLYQEAPTPQHMSRLQRQKGGDNLFDDLVARYSNPISQSSGNSSRGSSETPMLPRVDPDQSINNSAPRARNPAQAISTPSVDEIIGYQQISSNSASRNQSMDDKATLPVVLQARTPQAEIYQNHGTGSVAKKKARIEHRSSSLET